MSFDKILKNIDLNGVFDYVSKKGVTGTISGLTETYKTAVIAKHSIENMGETFGLALQYPELASTLKYNFNDMAQLVNISATISNDSKVDIRKLPKKIGDVSFKVTRDVKPK